MKAVPPIKSSRIRSAAAVASLGLSLATTGLAANEGDVPSEPVKPAEVEPFVHFLLQLDVSDAYITPRGLYVENQGVVFQPLFLTFMDLYTNKSEFLNDVTLTLGVWNSIHSHASGADPGKWNEIDPIAGLSFGLGEYSTFEINYTAFKSQTNSYPTSQPPELKYKFNDSKWLGDFALNPFVAYWQELENKATVVFDPSTSEESFYFTLGISPSVKLGPVKLDFPTYINIVGDEFYQEFDGSAGGGGLAVFGTEIKASVPLTFVPKDYGFWSVYAGLRYYHLSNDGVRDGNIALVGADAGSESSLWQVHGGLAIFF